MTDIGRSVNFYTKILGFDLAGASSAGDKKYAFLKEGETLVLTLWQQADEPFQKNASGLHHLSFSVNEIGQVREIESRVREVGAKLYHGGIVPHSEGATSGGIFFEDPDGTHLEVFVPSGVEEGVAPTSGAPTCGFL